MITFSLVLVFVITFGIVWSINNRRKQIIKGSRPIPGPNGLLPLIWNMFQLEKLPHLQLSRLNEKYGDIYQIEIGPLRFILISNAKMLKEILNDSNFAGRPFMDGFDVYPDERLGLINAEGEMWDVHRKFLLKQLRDFGIGKSSIIETIIMDEVNDSLLRFKQNKGKPISSSDLKNILTVGVVNTLWSVLAGERFQQDDKNLLKLVTNTNRIFDETFTSIGGVLFTFFPKLKKMFPSILGYTEFRKVIETNRSWFEEMVSKHKQNFQEDSHPRDFIDAYLKEMNKATAAADPSSVFHGKRAERQLVTILADLFFAGTETTAVTLEWAVLYLCKNPHVQEKLSEEISAVTLNSSRSVSLADRPNMPYTVALIDEVFRMSSIAPAGVQHRALEDKVFQGYFIRKDTWILSSLHYLHNSKKIWGDPQNFRPERFLSEDGVKYQKSENLLPFQIGKRQCVAEGLGRDTIFLYLANIFQRFEISFDPKQAEPSLEPKPSMVLSPQHFSVVLKDRLNWNT